MNDKFFGLPEEKQERIIQAAYRVFARNTYKKSPMHEIAGMAGISKSLLSIQKISGSFSGYPRRLPRLFHKTPARQSKPYLGFP